MSQMMTSRLRSKHGSDTDQETEVVQLGQVSQRTWLHVRVVGPEGLDGVVVVEELRDERVVVDRPLLEDLLLGGVLQVAEAGERLLTPSLPQLH